MAINIQTPNGEITLTNDVISIVVGAAVTDNYGVVGMVSKHFFRDNLTEILKKKIIPKEWLSLKMEVTSL